MPNTDLLKALETVRVAGNYHRWIFRRIEPELGERVLDVGSGLGDLAELFARSQPSRRVILSDASAEMAEKLSRKAEGISGLHAMRLDAAADGASAGLDWPFVPDSVTCLNVLEHIEDDVQALRNMRQWVGPGGRLILLVPALDCLYGSLDRLAGHYRRYDRRKLSECLEASGWALRRLEYFNFWGLLTWFLGGRILCQKQFNADVCGYLDKLVPLLSLLEKIMKPFAGQSLIAVAENSQS